MNIEPVLVEHPARVWALEGITQHSLEVVGVAGDHLNTERLRYIVTHNANRAMHGYLEGKYFWGVFWVSYVYAHNQHALAALLSRVSHHIQAVSVHRVIIVTESKVLYTYLKALGLSPVYAPSVGIDTSPTDLDVRYVFDWDCRSILLNTYPSQVYEVVCGSIGNPVHARQAASTKRYGWMAQSAEGARIGYIELGVHKHQAHLRLLYTDPAYRQQGVARFLVDRAVQYAMLQHCTLVTVETLSHQAVMFYEKQGFHKVFTLEGLRPMCVSTPLATSRISDPLSFIFLTRLIS